VEIDKGVMEVFERQLSVNWQRGVLIKAVRKNRLYIMNVNLTAPVCLMVRMDE
jgi:hypothetical protein